MSDELTKLLHKPPDEIAKQLLSDVFKKRNLFPWTSLNVVKDESNNDYYDSFPDKCLYAALTLLLEQLRQLNPVYADILERIYWKRTPTKKVAQVFNKEHQYATDSGTFFKWFRDARYQFGVILLEHERKSNISPKSTSSPLKLNEINLSQASKQTLPTTTLSILSPLEPDQRMRTRNAKSISTLGITLIRFLPAFQYEFCEMLECGGKLRILLVNPDSPAIEMASKRLDIGTPVRTQKRRVEDMLELLSIWKSNIPDANLQVKLLDYLPPYGITIIDPRSETSDAFCLVRLYTFRTPTSTAPTIKPDPIHETYWFDFFRVQFETIWEFAEPYELLNIIDRTNT